MSAPERKTCVACGRTHRRPTDVGRSRACAWFVRLEARARDGYVYVPSSAEWVFRKLGIPLATRDPALEHPCWARFDDVRSVLMDLPPVSGTARRLAVLLPAAERVQRDGTPWRIAWHLQLAASGGRMLREFGDLTAPVHPWELS